MERMKEGIVGRMIVSFFFDGRVQREGMQGGIMQGWTTRVKVSYARVCINAQSLKTLSSQPTFDATFIPKNSCAWRLSRSDVMTCFRFA